MKNVALFTVLFLFSFVRSQLYFPPLTGNSWETISPNDLNWCPNKIDSLYQFLEAQDTKAFMVLKDGKIVLEQYFGGQTQNSLWYWASAGKTITSFLIGMAQQEGLLDINDATSDYLGSGWASCTPEQENAITIRNQLTMTSGLNDGVANPFCTLPECLEYLAAPGTRWAYHNGPYTLLDQVISQASGMTLNQFVTQKLKNPIGMTGSFTQVDDNMVFFSTARSMARFGLLILNNGVWNGNTVMTDQQYFQAMVNTSQNLNRGYGYLWWLNGKQNFMVPGSQLTIPGSIMPNAPDDMISALGKNGQFLNVVPSQKLILIRMGNEPTGSLVPFLMNDKIWEYMNALNCNQSSLVETKAEKLVVYPNPSKGTVTINNLSPGTVIKLYDLTGRCIKETMVQLVNDEFQLDDLTPGNYVIQCTNGSSIQEKKLIVLP